jgi:hypothetical protein
VVGMPVTTRDDLSSSRDKRQPRLSGRRLTFPGKRAQARAHYGRSPATTSMPDACTVQPYELLPKAGTAAEMQSP